MDSERKGRKGKCTSSAKRNTLHENVDRVQISQPKIKSRSNRSTSLSSSSSCHFSREASKRGKSEVPKISEENMVKRKPFSREGIKSLGEKSLKSNVNFSGKSRKIASCVPEKKLKKRVGDFGMNVKSRTVKGLFKQRTEVSSEKCTPTVKVVCGGNFDSGKSVNAKDDTGNTSDSVKTPPVESSISPEIQFQSNVEPLVFKSGTAPVCYGAGHLLSGVTDKRKCRRRGSLRGGVEKPICNDIDGTSLFDDSVAEKCMVPLLGEASVRWLPSDDLASPSSISNFGEISYGSNVVHSETECLAETLERVSFSSSSNSSLGKDFGMHLHRGRFINSCSSDAEVENMSLKISWQDCSVGRTAGTSELYNSCLSNGESGDRSYDRSVVEAEKINLGSWESDASLENMVQLPWQRSSVDITDELDSCCLSDEKISNHSYVDRFGEREEKDTCLYSWESDAAMENVVQSQLTIPRQSKSLHRTSGNVEFNEEIIEHSYDKAPVKVKESYLGSWESDATVETMGQSQLRISWQDNSADLSFGANHSGSFCLSNEGSIDHDDNDFSLDTKEPDFRLEVDEDQENFVRLDTDLSPLLLDYEPIISSRTKEKPLTRIHNDESAESIVMNPGSLVASDNSDWCHCFEIQ